MRKIRREDEVIVIAGRDKGRRGTVDRVVSAERLIVSGINMVKKHYKPNPQTNEPGGIRDIEASIHVSNVALYNPESGKADRVAIRTVDGKRARFFKSTDTPVDE